MDSVDFISFDEPWLSELTGLWKPEKLDLGSTEALSSFKPTSLQVYTRHSRGLWQPTHSSTFIVMKSICNHRTLLTDTIEPIAHCPTLEAAYQALNTLMEKLPDAVLIEKRFKEPAWGYFKIVSEKRMHTFWVKEVGHARTLNWMDLDVDDSLVREDSTAGDAASGTASDGSVSDTSNHSDATIVIGSTTVDDMPTRRPNGIVPDGYVVEDHARSAPGMVGGLRHVFVGHRI